MKQKIVLIVHNIRSTYNVGSLLRTADGLGVSHVYLTGYTPYPLLDHDDRLPHIGRKTAAAINKTALGAEKNVDWSYNPEALAVLEDLIEKGYELVALEQHPDAIPLPEFKPKHKVALLLGEEVAGIQNGLIDLCDTIIEIPMFGKKESFNVSVAAAIALAHIRFS